MSVVGLVFLTLFTALFLALALGVTFLVIVFLAFVVVLLCVLTIGSDLKSFFISSVSTRRTSTCCSKWTLSNVWTGQH